MITEHVVGDGNWTAVPVPEPTSAVGASAHFGVVPQSLLLLGVAGMALRRRRA